MIRFLSKILATHSNDLVPTIMFTTLLSSGWRERKKGRNRGDPLTIEATCLKEIKRLRFFNSASFRPNPKQIVLSPHGFGFSNFGQIPIEIEKVTN